MNQRVATKQLFRSIEGHIQTTLPLGLADVVSRFDGDAEAAIEEHVADFSTRSGASVLVGFTASQSSGMTLDGHASATTLPVTILAVRRRHGDASMAVSAEALDDLMDALRTTLADRGLYSTDSGIAVLTHVETVGLVGGGDWLGRALTYTLHPLA